MPFISLQIKKSPEIHVRYADEFSLNEFQVEYILGFGAAAVIVLTIIIVLILYLILQCRSQRRKRRAARAAGLHCDSNSGSYMERSTVDFIVPGEMELTSAVRSVSASAKCNGVAAKTLIQPPKVLNIIKQCITDPQFRTQAILAFIECSQITEVFDVSNSFMLKLQK